MRLVLTLLVFLLPLTSHSKPLFLEMNLAIPATLIANCYNCASNIGALAAFEKNSRVSYIFGLQKSFYHYSKMDEKSESLISTRVVDVEGTEIIGGLKYLLEDKKEKTYFSLYAGKGWGSGEFSNREVTEDGNVQFTTLNFGLSVHWPFKNYPSTGVHLGIIETLLYYDDTSDFPNAADKKRFIINMPSIFLGLFAYL